MSDFAKDLLSRAGRTFWQAMAAYLLSDLPALQRILDNWTDGKRLLLTLFVGAAAAGLSAVYNGVIVPWLRGGGDGK